MKRCLGSTDSSAAVRVVSARSHQSLLRFLMVALAVLAGTAEAEGQTSVSVSGGAAPYDLSGTGTSGVVAARVDVALNRWVSGQAGSSYFWYTTQADRSVAMLIPEVGIMVSPPTLPLYLGAGIGHTVGTKGDRPGKFELYAALGADIEAGGGWAIRPEGRLHNVDPWVGTIMEVTLGVRRRLVAASA